MRSQNWTARFQLEFEQRRGYDPAPFLPAFRGYVIDNEQTTERFLWDIRQTAQELVIENQATRLRELAEDKFSPIRGYHHYVSMARKNLREHLYHDLVRYKKYLYVLRPLLAARWIREGRGVPPMRFAQLVAATSLDPALVAEIDALLEVKMRAGEAATSPRWAGIHDFIEREPDAAEAHSFAKQPKVDTAVLDAFLHDAVQHFDARRDNWNNEEF